MKRPIAVTMVGCLFIVAGSAGLAYHLRERPLEPHIELVSLIRILAIVGGVALLLRQSWARWLLVAWMGFHVGVSVLHSTAELMLYLAVFAVVGFVLYRRSVSAYLGGTASP